MSEAAAGTSVDSILSDRHRHVLEIESAITAAAALVQLDVSVIRLHGIVDGRCTCGRRGCRTTWTARSGSGGLHLYLRHPDYPVGNRQIAGIGDLRGDGGLIVAPPSLHVSGNRYEWLPGRTPW